jgi:acyl-CoA thioesterase FadM
MYRLRFIWIIFKCFFTKRKDLLDTYTLNFIALPLIDTDLSRLFTQAYSSYMGLARWHYVFASKFRNVALKKFWAPVTVAESMIYQRSIKAFSRIELKTNLICWDEKRFYLEQKFYVKGKLHAKAFLEGIIRSPQSPLRPPKVFKGLGVEMNSPPFPEYIKLWIESKNKSTDFILKERTNS